MCVRKLKFLDCVFLIHMILLYTNKYLVSEERGRQMSKSKLNKILRRLEKGEIGSQQASKQVNENYTMQDRNQMIAYIRKFERRLEYIIQFHTARDLYFQMNHAETGVFYKLLMYLQWNKEGLLVQGGRPLRQKELREITGLGDRQLRKMLNRFEELELLIKSGSKKNQKYIMNPEFARIGKITGKKTPFTQLFKTTGRYVAGKLDTKQLGFLLKLSFFIDYKTLVLAQNPYEKDPDKVVPLHIKDISELLGISDQTTKAYMKALTDADIIYEERTEGDPKSKRSFYIHPQLMYRGNKDGDGHGDIYHKVVGYLRDLPKRMKYDAERKLTEEMSSLIMQASDKSEVKIPTTTQPAKKH